MSTQTMGPPSPRETRRSGRRSAPSTSTSNSKSPDSEQPPRGKDTSSRSAMASNTTNGRSRRPKQEDFEDPVDDRKPNSAPSVASNGSTQGASNGKGKRRGKEKDKQPPPEEVVDEPPAAPLDENDPQNDDEEQGITRCVCGSTEDDPDAGEFMVQCEGCKVWQHGLCMGYQSEDQVHDDDYYCEQCKPDLHVDLLKKLSQKKGRHGGGASHHNSAASRVSRSHSPTLTAKQPSRRRNTMNSRDAEFAETFKEIIEATAAEAAAAKDGGQGSTNDEAATANGDSEVQANGKKKRKRAEEEPAIKKRTRSASTTSERPPSVIARDETPMNGIVKAPSQAPAPAKGGGKGKRGGRKATTVEIAATPDGEEVPTPTTTTTATTNKRGGNRKGAGAKRPPLSHATSHNSGIANQDQGGRRSGTGNANGQHSGSIAVDARAYRNTHAYVVSQQPLLTSWGLPDYLAHLEHILPTDIPQPLEVPSGPSNNPSGSRGESAERTMERGVKVKWPSKRMSVGDMNKRVRALVEWVGREQASAHDRERRREALENELKQQQLRGITSVDDEAAMLVDEEGPSNTATGGNGQEGNGGQQPQQPLPPIKTIDKESSASTMKQMEELMEELIGFQERFGPGAKARDRERRNNPISAVS
ncbi:hypothetical protein CC1G_14233 [Coprinopsis cinerea okayama7|uniref:PHD-type domain-containing protein n=1 Tax=Coprinopsis cinerea (strain Okayama-7 / 130 / ATCC MYA-4618 / FGSC 9003) TaxID=240176 RepID=D6RLE2_COPC7|nr:hypothetical protein CC1G_14233 [Coprinopsis cinerea okayama7\|eukprot:XP_002911702.1 hypothetical protein CC1G_14233 [Coprinopsis cinerea okayama7\